MGLEGSGRGALAWLGTDFLSLGIGGGPSLARVPGPRPLSPDWFPLF